MSDLVHFLDVTEIEGQAVSQEQLQRSWHRYAWAVRHVAGKSVLEVACGSGAGLGMIKAAASRVCAGDVSPAVLEKCRKEYGDSIELGVFDAGSLPFADAEFDVILLFEAIYYLDDPARFFAEAHRVLKDKGKLLVVTANKDLYDFNPSPHSKRYLGSVEMAQELSAFAFDVEAAGNLDTKHVCLRQKLLRPVKFAAARLNLIPGTMHAKAALKKFFFGSMTVMPPSLEGLPFDYVAPSPISTSHPDKRHKVLYFCAEKRGSV